MEKRIKSSFAAAHVVYHHVDTTSINRHCPRPGDAAVFRVVEANSELLRDDKGANHTLFTGDLILGVFGNRYATNQIEGYVPEAPATRCQLLSRGGVVGVLASVNHTYKPEIIELELVGYAVDEQGQVANSINWDRLRKSAMRVPSSSARIILSIGSSMDSGKTTTAAYLCAGLEAAGRRAAYIKLTGTAFPKDARYVYDRGASLAVDFAQFGFPSTYLMEESTLLQLHRALLNEVEWMAHPDYIVIEIADGLLQRETEMLLKNHAFMSGIAGVVLSCGDSLGVLSGLHWLEKCGIAPKAVSGLFTASELLVKEVQPHIAYPVLNLADLLDAGVESYFAAASLHERVLHRA